MIRKHMIFSAAFLAVFLALGCTGKQEQSPEKITYRLKWIFNAGAAGGIYARDAGFFAEKGLDVEIKEGGRGYDAIQELELGRAGFGTASADQVIRAVEKGSPIVVIAQLFQANPLQWIYRKNKTTIDSPDDHQGKDHRNNTRRKRRGRHEGASCSI